MHASDGFHLLHQAEGGCATCSRQCPGMSPALFGDSSVSLCTARDYCPLNGGQLLARSAEVVEAVMRSQPCFSGGGEIELDQDIAERILHAADTPWRTCSLPQGFSGHCWFNVEHLPWCELVAYHMQCLPTRMRKYSRMREVLDKVAAAGCRAANETRPSSSHEWKVQSDEDAPASAMASAPWRGVVAAANDALARAVRPHKRLGVLRGVAKSKGRGKAAKGKGRGA